VTLPISNQTEQFIIKALRAAGALTLSLVADIDGRVVGHVAFSPVLMSDGTTGWYGLGPVSVLPEYQKQGIGKALINEGLTLQGVPQEVFLALPFGETVPHGTATFHEGFWATG
jgi:putative acetyltransferase